MDESVLARLRRIRKIVSRGVFVILVVVAAWILNHLGGNGMGVLPDSGKTALPQPSTPAPSGATTQAMQVVIREDGYYVGGDEQTIEQIVASAAEARSASGPAVKIISGPDSRVGAEQDLETALNNAHLPWTLESGPADAP